VGATSCISLTTVYRVTLQLSRRHDERTIESGDLLNRMEILKERFGRGETSSL
jgi:uncharacterized membrane protein